MRRIGCGCLIGAVGFGTGFGAVGFGTGLGAGVDFGEGVGFDGGSVGAGVA